MATLSRSNSWTRLSDKAAPETVCRTPLPWRELTVVLLVLTTESIAFQYLFPFVPFMVRGFGIVEEDVGFYSGWIASAFMVGQFFSSLFWGRLSDIIGLKPVMLTGMFFTAVTVFLFGFSKSLEWALACRFVGGLFNGVIGVTKTYIGLITDETNEAQAFGSVALCWGFGGVLGPSIGGLLSQPASKYPHVFAADSIWADYPFLLPCFVTSLIPSGGLMMALIWLKEPSRDKNKRRKNPPALATNSESQVPELHHQNGQNQTFGVTSAGKWQDSVPHLKDSVPHMHMHMHMELKESIPWVNESVARGGRVVGVIAVADAGNIHTTTTTHHTSVHPDAQGMGGQARSDDVHVGVCVSPSQRLPLLECDACAHADADGQEQHAPAVAPAPPPEERAAMSYAFGRKAVVATVAYMVMRLAVIGLDDALPLFMSTPPPQGGMGFTSNDIGIALFGQGVLLVAHVLIIFPFLKERMGTLQLFWLAALTVPFVCCLPPLLADIQPHVSRRVLWVCVEVCLALKVMSFATGFTAVTLLINNSAPSRVIGTVNGCSQTAAAFSSMIAPSLAGTLFSWSLQNDLDFPFDFHFTFFFFGVTAFGLLACAVALPPSISHRYVEE